ncbi:PREDICTED: sialin-like [Nicrophorus vespilloides]|uniref:Sialin-like n=1 Tax=Nicrophorus vespilloides TaxID=110193 RepID=A0ABM1MXJ9_NICVS|nr:PREDICTED: sialin-like [Nicrophorus vespilloides]
MEERRKCYIPMRVVLAINVFTATLMSYMMRVNLSIIIIAMVKPTGLSKRISDSECIDAGNSSANTANVSLLDVGLFLYGERYAWDQTSQGYILGGYFYGYVLTSFPGGIIAEYIGPYQTVGVTTLISAALTACTPFIASLHFSVILVNRMLLGALAGVVFPALQCLIARWVPPVEKGIFIGCLLGGTFGTVITWPLLSEVIMRMGWTWAFYVSGLLPGLWCIFWYLTVSNYPDQHRCIDEREKNYIQEAVSSNIAKKKAIPPYKAMFMSFPFWALVFLQFGNLWGLYLLLTIGPKFISEILGFDIRKSGFLSALPHLTRLVSGFIFGAIGDYIRKRGKLSVTFVRKFFVLFSHMLPSVFLFLITMVGCNRMWAVAFMSLALGFNGAATITNLQNAQDLAPNFAGTIYGIINMTGNMAGFLAPLIAGYVTQENNGLSEWHIVFWLGASIYMGCAIIFSFFGSGDVQPWNKKPDAGET